MTLKIIMLNVRQDKNDYRLCHCIPLKFWKCKVTDSDRIKTSGSLGMGGVGTGGSEGMRWTRKKPWEVMQVFSTSSVVMVSKVHKKVQSYQTVQLQYVQFAVCQSYLNKAACKSPS